MKKKNSMLEKLQAQPSAKNISSKVTTATEAIEPTSIISRKYAKEPLDIAKKASEIDQNLDEIVEFLEKKPQKSLPNLKQVYDSTGKLVDLPESVGSKIKPKGKGRLGLLASLIGGGIAALAPESKAAEIVDKISEASSKMDPATYLQEGIDTFDKKFQEMKQKSKDEKALKQMVEPMIKSVGGEPDMKPKKAMELVGEQESPDIEEMDNTVNYEDYLKKKKRQLGYE